MNVQEIMQTKVYTVKLDSPVSQVASMIAQLGISGVPVLDDDDHIAGIISEKDVINVMYPTYNELISDPRESRNFTAMEERYSDLARVKAKEIMTRHVIIIPKSMPVLQASSHMIRNGFRRLPVVNKEGDKKLAGIITLGDIHQALFSQHVMKTMK